MTDFKRPKVASEGFLKELRKMYRSYVLGETVIDDIHSYQQWLEWKLEENEQVITDLLQGQSELTRELENYERLVNRNIQLLHEREYLTNQIEEYEAMVNAKTSIINKLTIAKTKGEHNES